MDDNDEDCGVAFFPCPYLGGLVELNEERERHIREEHSTLIPDHTGYIASVLVVRQCRIDG